MALFGMDLETWQPFQGCTTFRTDLTLDRIPGHMALCLAEMDRAVNYRSMNEDVDIYIHKVTTKGDYTSNGTYVGAGMPLYEVVFEAENSYYHKVRAPNRNALRDALKLLYPTCKVGR